MFNTLDKMCVISEGYCDCLKHIQGSGFVSAMLETPHVWDKTQGNACKHWVNHYREGWIQCLIDCDPDGNQE